MIRKHIILFGAGKSSTILISYLLNACAMNNWHLHIADGNLQLAKSKIGETAVGTAIGINAEDAYQRGALVQRADLVISLLPPTLHILVAIDCLRYRKSLLTASYVDKTISELASEIKDSNLLFLCEMGLDPGIDHMSAMRMIHRIMDEGGKITSFKSHCGGLTAPHCDDNPWRYKISWNPRNIVLAGNTGAIYKSNNAIVHVSHEDLFSNCGEVSIGQLDKLAFYPNRDSLPYASGYGLEDAATFMRTTLRYPEFCYAWNAIVRGGLIDNHHTANTAPVTFRQWSRSILPYVDDLNRKQLEFLGLFDEVPVPDNLQSATDVLQYLLESKLMMNPQDKDMVVMMHEVSFTLNSKLHHSKSILIVQGQDSLNTAMAKTVGLPLGIAARLVLQNKISLTGLHIPIIPAIYDPVLKELEAEGIIFNEPPETEE